MVIGKSFFNAIWELCHLGSYRNERSENSYIGLFLRKKA